MTDSNDALIIFAIDRSGSMGSQVQETVDGFNAFIEEQRGNPGSARVSLTFFDTSFETRYVATPIEELPPLGSPENKFIPSGMTALFDAVGVSVKGAEGWLKNHPDFNGQVYVVVITDGGENSSKQWHINHPMIDGDASDVGGLIKYKQEEGWQFVFLGSGGSNWLERTFGHVAAANSFAGYSNDAVSNRTAYRGVSANMTRSRVSGSAFVAPDVDALVKEQESASVS